MQRKTLILGIGNDILKDDGIGPYLATHIHRYLDAPGVETASVCLGGLEMLEYIKDYDYVYIIDAIKTRDGKVGDVYFVKPSNFKETLHLSSLHDVGFLTALDLGRELNLRLPVDIRIAAIEIREDTEFGTDFTPELQQKLEEVQETVTEEIKKWLDELNLSN